MRAWLPYLSSALVHGGFIATLHWVCEAPAPARYALEAGDAHIELMWRQPREIETPATEVTLPSEQPVQPEPPTPQPTEVLHERQEAQLPAREQAAELVVTDLPADVVAAPRASTEEPASPPAAAPAEPVERRPVRTPVPATPAAFQPPAVAGASVDEMPQKLPRNPAPPYPAAAYSARQEGVVLVRAQISATGVVADARLEESCGFALLDQSAVDTVRQWRFAPARRAGVAVAHEILVPVRFQLAARRPA